MTASDLPLVNASLNALSTVFICAGLAMIKSERKLAHIACMATALVTSTAFLTCYLIYHANTGATRVSEQFPAVSAGLRNVYLWIVLLPHTLLAVAMLPFIGISLLLAYARKWPKHQRIGPWTFAMWLYVSVTGVIIYWMLYHLFPGIQQSSLAGV